ncbi:acyl carrier protein [Cohnella endophytica]|uniref:Acyl carrier protein n=1 Tax=Cohnella endophytica TaxID=2419778 RepID=A0A494Y1C2_9BACL|nr:acyl carrier protein [Cohnella endophytica]RKP54142.1 acyl carrier protein [Cohnella endophytica]
MNQEQLINELRVIIAETIEIDDFTDDENFISDLGVDSMMIIEIVARLEKKYRIDIEESYLHQMTTFNQLVATVKEIMESNGQVGGGR